MRSLEELNAHEHAHDNSGWLIRWLMDTKGGIWPPYKALYIEAMLFNARSAVASIERVSVTIDA